MNVFLAADTHFSHRGIVKFEKDGKPVRPWDTTEAMDEALIENWNSVVKPTDKVYLLGDVVINRSAISQIGRCNGVKILIKGNHDTLRLEEYAPYFKDIRGVGMLDNFVLTHVPVHTNELAPNGRWIANIHGHLHTDVVMKAAYARTGNSECPREWIHIPDPKYLCVSMEQINFTPISLEDAKKKWEAQQC